MSERRLSPGFSGTDPTASIALHREQFLQGIREQGFELEPAIQDVVVMLNLNGLKTSMSCEGHIESEGADLDVAYEELVKNEVKVIGGPWVTLDIDDSSDSQQFSSEAEKAVDYSRRCFEVEERLLGFLDGFYATRQVPADVRLSFAGDGGYTFTNQGGSLLQYPQGMERALRIQKLEVYRAEMNEFAAFLGRQLV